jgi:hypothetical protein
VRDAARVDIRANRQRSSLRIDAPRRAGWPTGCSLSRLTTGSEAAVNIPSCFCLKGAREDASTAYAARGLDAIVERRRGAYHGEFTDKFGVPWALIREPGA